MQASRIDGDRANTPTGAREGTPGPTAPIATEPSRLQPLPYEGASLDPGGLLGGWQQLNRTATIDHCVAQLETAGNLANLRRLEDPSREPFHGYWFADSDIYKVLEAIGWETGRAGDDGWSTFVDETVALLRKAQEDDGYLNSYIQGDHPDKRWQELEMSHELYCLGHMIQGAVALSRGAGRDDLLEIARRFADLVVERFGPDGGEPGLDGHPEPETALVELYRHTRDERYLDMASKMVERRGRGLLAEQHFGPPYLQDHLPVREATEPIGHAVRQLYLAAGVTDVYLETGDASLLEAMEELWRRTVTEKTYVTGAVGSRHRDEAFGDPYELPADRAYGETCASIASFLWNWRLLLATGKGRYADEMERALFNGIAVSTSTDGCHFTYSNPLHLRAGHEGSDEDSPSERLSWFKCACCPPNLARLVASLHHYLATRDDDGVQLHLIAPGRIESVAPDGRPVSLTVSTEYPWDGRVEIAVESPASEWTLSLRIPGWSEGATLTVDGESVPAEADEHGYVRVRRAWEGTARVVLDLPMPVRVLVPHPRIDAVRGCVALARGPVVYCIEQADHPADVAVEDLRLDPAVPPQPDGGNAELGVPVTLVGPARVLTDGPEDPYPSLERGAPAPAAEATLTAIPYFRWANRGPNAMRVWIPTA
ncbi:MAG TPA: beta-L-arabinofuranosidase domain-containing protein [Solirubrobacteraceae bacterium]|nr:beta-L-arabinofuranosidase domain-containing protein [Solirubrobacteraceae bacterium]